jgi:hypothetical protein
MKKEVKGRLVGSLFWLRDLAHLDHLSTSSYARHIALEEFYTGLLPLVDMFAECVQKNNIIEQIAIPSSYTSIVKEDNRIVVIMEAVKDEIENNAFIFTRGEMNVLDDIVTLIDRTVYKLNNLV